jgi:hypothetical protein
MTASLLILLLANSQQNRREAVMKENSQLQFTNQSFFIGIDVHKRNWTVTIRMDQLNLKTFYSHTARGTRPERPEKPGQAPHRKHGRHDDFFSNFASEVKKIYLLLSILSLPEDRNEKGKTQRCRQDAGIHPNPHQRSDLAVRSGQIVRLLALACVQDLQGNPREDPVRIHPGLQDLPGRPETQG